MTESPTGPVVDGAAFTLPPEETEPERSQPHAPTVALRCASLLKPLYFWAAATEPAYRDRPEAWAELAGPAVRESANDPTDAIWERCGADALLDGIARLTGVHWHSDPSAERSFGRVLVRAGEVARAFAALAVAARDDATVAGPLLGWMREVPHRQTFGARDAAAEQLSAAPADVAVKPAGSSMTTRRHCAPTP